MSGRALTRRIADALTTHASRTMPIAFSGWAVAMRNELSHVPGDRQALRWAIGCVVTAYRMRARQHAYAARVLRASGAVLVLFCAFDATVPSVIAGLHSLGILQYFNGLAGVVPGDDFSRLVPLAEALPLWLHLLIIGTGACYAAAARSLLARSDFARPLLVAGVSLGWASTWVAQAILEPLGRVATNPSLLSTIAVPLAVPLLAAAAARHR